MSLPTPTADGREAALRAWLQTTQATLPLQLDSLSPLGSDASVRRYWRLRSADGRALVAMDDPAAPNQLPAYLSVGQRMAACGLHVPEVLAADAAQGFALLEDLGDALFLPVLQAAQRAGEHDTPQRLMRGASEALLRWQSQGLQHGGPLPVYDEAFVRRELQIFVDWCVVKEFGQQWSDKQQQWWEHSCKVLVRNMGEQIQVPMHRDFMVRNLVACADGSVGVLDFQDAVLGPISYDMGSLLRDAFISWEEDEELDWAIRYWEGARRAGLFGHGEDAHPMAQDFGLFWKALEWTVLQRHLKIMGIFCRVKHRDGRLHYAADLPRFFAYTIKTAARYVELSPLLRLLEAMQPQLVQSDFTLR
ncbi:aminoglycoside phosphotransferase family protein [Roseateles sp. BYS180W]|uniref:Aminoglycoside phosphotransferase family protein n=1 Tax=Roseateles rivi TaxID=3299028 RepID=A0ABW7FTI4_9BURK